MDELDKLLDQATEALRRDIKHINILVLAGKLDEKSARDLVGYIKVLTAIKKANKQTEADDAEDLDSVSEEDLVKQARELLKAKKKS